MTLSKAFLDGLESGEYRWVKVSVDDAWEIARIVVEYWPSEVFYNAYLTDGGVIELYELGNIGPVVDEPNFED